MNIFKTLNRILDAFLLVLFIFLFLIGLYSVIDSIIVYRHASDPSLLRYRPSVTETDEQGDGTLPGETAWLTIPDTNIDYPVMQGTDNTEYLNKDPYGEYSFSGSIFLDAENKADFTDSYNLVYGHHMEADKMFGGLDSFLDREYFDDHSTGTLICPEQNYEVKFFAAFRVKAQDDVFFDVLSTSDRSVVDRINDPVFEPAVNESTGKERHLIALSTCKDTDSSDRTVVIGTLEKAAE